MWACIKRSKASSISPFCIERMNTGKHIKIERAILGTLFVAYFGGIAYALFFMFPPNFGTDGAIRHAANFALGVAVCEAYTAGGAGLIGSQFMWNILLFLPLGFLSLLFRRVQLHWWHATAVGLLISILCEAVQFFIGRSADVDDVAANTLGTAIGYACFALGNRIARPRTDRDHLSWTRMLPWYALSLLLILGALALPLFCLDSLQAASRYGLVRWAAVRLPYSAEVLESLPEEAPEMACYRRITVDQTEECRRLALAMGLQGEMWEDETLSTLEGMGGSVSVDAYGEWSYHGTGVPHKCDDLAAWIAPLLWNGEHIDSIQRISDAGRNDASDKSDTYSRIMIGTDSNEVILLKNEIQVIYDSDGRSSVHTNLLRVKAEGTLPAISPKEAYRSAMFVGRYAAPNAEVIPDQMDIAYLSVWRNEWIVPCYVFSYRIQGETTEHRAWVDAVRR